jgi:3'-5' exoribonuclease
MAQRQNINSLQAQSQVNEVYRVLDKQLRSNRQGNLYILLQLGDKTGQVSGMRWNANQGLFDSFDKGDFMSVEGVSQVFNGNIQVIVNDFEILDEANIDMSEFDQVDRAAQAELWERLKQMIDSMTNEQVRAVGQSFYQDEAICEQFSAAPAGIKLHHAYSGGLLQHVVDLMTVANAVAGCYPAVDRDLLILGAMIHDIGKLEELAYDGEMSYSDPGQMIGHLVQGVQMLDRQLAKMEATDGTTIDEEIVWRLQHMIVSHHGTLEHGSPKVPMTIEAIVLHQLDNMDAKVAAAIELVKSDMDTRNPWTNYNPSMGRKIYKPSVAS